MSERPVLDVRDLVLGTAPAHGAAVPIVRGVSLSLEPGARVALVGESGCGKSLTALALMGLLPRGVRALSGSIRLEEAELVGASERTLRALRGDRVAMIYQNPLTSLSPVHTIGRQLIDALRAHQRIDRRAARERAAELLDEVGIPRAATRLDDHPHQFSGGMRQRVMIAMALVGEPRVLIADECTTALDVTTQARVLETLVALAQRRGTALLFITHDLALASATCEQVRVMYAGRIVERAPAGPFFGGPRHPYAEMLLGAICDLDVELGRPLTTIAGQPPAPAAIPRGCAFQDRCPAVLERCRAVAPPDVALGGEQQWTVECHLHAPDVEAVA
ncbi:ABC transporter ATP-binding protein [Conexibacter woesei]|uniref:Oligopeptide/dipeptide ABC transporter, ATPase subunit n=1 Tax=Conexibacter woesei (strain DSM 14684 / CCUG 47730 / CIP 108061 / JCM 11494 / NBRC 100937 / ID131577) TaxID=469383 RepID=D3FDD0_CONWI|nr:ABC transporter ATP-binding protein [Conexibacter woesei]ADB53522.1 oligopeptide/dipeptide ABC transporter, ATPase subunit [Conexibacter woesei DSM 14684]